MLKLTMSRGSALIEGFTLIEAIIVITVIAILAIVVTLTGNPFDKIKLDNAVRKVAADIRYAQKLAITTQQRAGLKFNSGGYEVYQDVNAGLANGTGEPCSTDASGKFSVVFGNCDEYKNVAISTPITNAVNDTIAFNSVGAPISNTGAALDTAVITINYSGSKTIAVYNGTGKVAY